MLEGEDLDWWESVDQTLTEEIRDRLSWIVFVEKLNSRFCSEGAMQPNEKEFLNMQKCSLTVAKYNTSFTEKLQIARHLCPLKRSLIARYVEGLPYPYQSVVRGQTTLEAAMEEARRVEDDLRVLNPQEKGGEKRKWEGSIGSSNKKVTNNFKGGKITMKYRRCGKMCHMMKDCRSREVICYNCQEMGHFASQCTNPKVGNINAEKRNEIPRSK